MSLARSLRVFRSMDLSVLPGHEDAGVYSIEVTASDGDESATDAFILTVNLRAVTLWSDILFTQYPSKLSRF